VLADRGEEAVEVLDVLSLQLPAAEVGMQGGEVAFEQRPGDRLDAGVLVLAGQPGSEVGQDAGAAGG
jgi:hypothetical protein